MGKTVFIDDSFYANPGFIEVVMRITCPTCSTQYDVDENDIAFTGQDVQCTECMTVWTQTRSGEASNARLADALDGDKEQTPEVEKKVDVAQEDAISPIAVEDEDEDEDATRDDQEDEITAPEELEETKSDATLDSPEDDEPEGNSVEPETSVDDDNENPIWKEIAALAKEARAESEGESTSESDYSPPDDQPPIQSSPVIPDEAEPAIDTPDEDDRPWEVAAESDESFSDFVWSDPSKESATEAETDGAATDGDEDGSLDQSKPEFTPLTDTSGGPLGKMDDDLIAAALNEQMAIEDALEYAPQPAGRDISDVPVELGGPRSRIPNVEALKNSVRSKSVELTPDELQEQVPARRFRRGVTLILLIFVVLGAIYISRATITEYVPAIGPYLETYATYVDLLRAKAEVLGAYVWDSITQGYDLVIARFFS